MTESLSDKIPCMVVIVLDYNSITNTIVIYRLSLNNIRPNKVLLSLTGHELKMIIKVTVTYPRQERKSTLPVVSIAVGMRSKNENMINKYDKCYIIE